MDENEKLFSEVQSGREAQEIIENELVQDTLRIMRENIWVAFSKTSLHDEQTLVQLRYMLNAVDSFESNFIEVMETGQLAQATLDERKEQTED